MKNTGTLYRSTEKTPTVFPEFRDLLPPLSQEQRAALEKDILQNGCYSPLIVDQELRVVDGHNRLSICQSHEIPYTMLVFEFEEAEARCRSKSKEKHVCRWAGVSSWSCYRGRYGNIA